MCKLTDKNRLSIVNPELCKEWNYKKNGNLTPENISYGSGKKVWWKCRKNHEWTATPSDRYYHKSNCPYCSGNAIDSSNCLASLNSKLAKEWHPTKNNKLTPKRVSLKSGKKVWWKCRKNHEWTAVIRHRSNGSGCPYCSGRMALPENSLGDLYPILSKEFNNTKNLINPLKVLPGSHKKVWWKCRKCSYEWEAVIKSRALRGDGCPRCKKICLKDGATCDSRVEAFIYLTYVKQNIKFKHLGFYGNKMGKHRYDFYLPHANKYVEVTGFDLENNYGDAQYTKYLKTIKLKEDYVKNVLRANFEFIQIQLSPQQHKLVRENLLTQTLRNPCYFSTLPTEVSGEKPS